MSDTDTVAAEDEASVPSSRPRWWVYVLVAVGIAALAFAIGRFSTFGSAGATAAGPNAADIGFARDMQVHHTQAIEMAMEIYRKTDDDDVRRMAYDIATSQAGQRGEMYDWLVQWGLPQSGDPLMSWMTDASGHGEHGETGEALSDEELRTQMGMASAAELTELQAATGTEADCLYLSLMIRHHEGAIPMADAVIELGSVPRVLAVAESMKAGQTAEIDAMESAQARLGCTP
ncbi:DUF305 domain-containing protein [Microbacterium sp. SS28]|uniref:DUF305 domain-containing protein n=1 Tax=Microbacterium sp. SS28 TaxID=2919948 RepID=UPI001FAADD1A|nr:DUF305 domain-containing protein [Microbacterium sp. SS28]